MIVLFLFLVFYLSDYYFVVKIYVLSGKIASYYLNAFFVGKSRETRLLPWDHLKVLNK